VGGQLDERKSDTSILKPKLFTGRENVMQGFPVKNIARILQKYYTSHLVMMRFSPLKMASAREKRLIAISHTGQLGKDIERYHLRTDGPLETVGAIPLAVGAGIGKIGNTVVADISNALGADTHPIPLGEGNFKYMRRDVASVLDNTMAFGKNVLTLHPLRATGNALKTGFDLVDLTFVDPVLDGGTAVFGHAYEKKGSSRILSQAMDTRARMNKASMSDAPFSQN